MRVRKSGEEKKDKRENEKQGREKDKRKIKGPRLGSGQTKEEGKETRGTKELSRIQKV